MAVIRAEKHTTYKEALIHFKIESLESKRETLCLKYSIKAFKHPKFTNWFVRNEPAISTRSNKPTLKGHENQNQKIQKVTHSLSNWTFELIFIKKKS